MPQKIMLQKLKKFLELRCPGTTNLQKELEEKGHCFGFALLHGLYKHDIVNYRKALVQITNWDETESSLKQSARPIAGYYIESLADVFFFMMRRLPGFQANLSKEAFAEYKTFTVAQSNANQSSKLLPNNNTEKVLDENVSILKKEIYTEELDENNEIKIVKKTLYPKYREVYYTQVTSELIAFFDKHKDEIAKSICLIRNINHAIEIHYENGQ